MQQTWKMANITPENVADNNGCELDDTCYIYKVILKKLLFKQRWMNLLHHEQWKKLELTTIQLKDN